MDQYHLYVNGSQKGPYTIGQLQSMWNSGSITVQTLYWNGSTEQWSPLKEIQELLEPKAPPVMTSAARQAIYQEALAATRNAAGSDSLGQTLLIIPVISSALMWFWISGMSLIDRPGSTLSFLIIGTVVLTACIIAMDANRLGMGRVLNGKRTVSPVGWFLFTLLLWFLAYPFYLLDRKRFGAKNYVIGGTLSMLVFVVSSAFFTYTVEKQQDQFRENLDQIRRSFQ